MLQAQISNYIIVCYPYQKDCYSYRVFIFYRVVHIIRSISNYRRPELSDLLTVLQLDRTTPSECNASVGGCGGFSASISFLHTGVQTHGPVPIPLSSSLQISLEESMQKQKRRKKGRHRKEFRWWKLCNLMEMMQSDENIQYPQIENYF